VENALSKQLIFPRKVQIAISLNTRASYSSSQRLTHALLHSQPARPFCQVGDEQTLEFKRLAAIFEGARRSHKSKVLTPSDKTVGHDEPLMVQSTVEPPRVKYATMTQRVAQRTTTSILTPNSHRRTQTTPRRALTTPTTHAMVRRSAGQKYNLSQDMIA
jgi:hypothetical protein